MRSNSGAEVDCWDVEATEGGGGFVVVGFEVGGTVEVEAAAPESKSSRMSSSHYLNAGEVGEGMERDHLDRLGRRVLVALPCFDVWKRMVALNFGLESEVLIMTMVRLLGPSRIGGIPTNQTTQTRRWAAMAKKTMRNPIKTPRQTVERHKSSHGRPT